MTANSVSHNGRIIPDDMSDLGPLDDPSIQDVVRQVAAAVKQVLDDSSHYPSALTVRAGDVAIELSWAAAVQQVVPASVTPVVVPPAVEPDTRRYITAPTVGVFYCSASPGAAPFVTEGTEVTAGRQVAIVEAMKLMIPVEADAAGTIVNVLKKDGDQVEHGEPLFELG